MRRKNSRECAPGYRVEFTKKPVCGWGGFLTFCQFLETLGVRGLLGQALPDGRTSPNQVPVVDIAMQLLATFALGGSRFEHAGRITNDRVLQTILGIRRFGSPSSIRRYFSNLTQGQSEAIHQTLSKLVVSVLAGQRKSDVLDLDSTVFCRWGSQEGSSKGYNPLRKGRRSHHPLLAMLGEAKLIIHSWMRAGSASPHRGCREFLAETMALLGDAIRITGVRADAGFYSNEFLLALESHGLAYAIAMQMSNSVKRWCAQISTWQSVSPDIEIGEAFYHPFHWKAARRVIVIREAKRRQCKGVLFEIIDWEYRAIVTTMQEPALDVWRFYNKRGDCENRIKELKYDFNADGFCLNRFAGTEVVFRLNCFTFNLVSFYKTMVLEDTTITLSTIRTKVFVIGAILGASGRTTVVRLGLVGKWRQEFQRLLGRLATFAHSTAAQLRNSFETNALEAPSCWRLRSPDYMRPTFN